MSKSNKLTRAIRATTATALLAGVAMLASAAEAQRTLVDLVREGKRDSVLAAITSPHVDVNVKSPDGSTPLMWAAFNADREMVSALLKAGAKANVTSSYGATALTEAVKLGDAQMVKVLLDGGADVDSPNADNQTALMLTLAATPFTPNHLQIAKDLIAGGADLRAIEKFRDQTVLMWAAAANQPEIVDLVLAKAKDQVNLRAKHDDWARMITSEPRAQFGSRQTGGLTALLYATRAGCLRCAESLVAAGADVNKPNPDGVTPLINALDNRRFDIAMFLLDKGANPHTWDWHGRTPLLVAVTMNVAAGGGGRGGGPGAGGPGAGGPGAPAAAAAAATAAAAAARSGPAPTAIKVIDRLIDMGVDVNHQLTQKRPYGSGGGRFEQYDRRGGTGPLMIAVMNNDHEAMDVLLAHGAEVDLRNTFQMTPLMIAAGMSGTGRQGGGGGPPGGGDQTRALKTVEMLLDKGADVNAQVVNSHTKTAVLVSYVQGRDQEGKTALMSAAEGGRDRIVKLLLDRGANANIKDASGKTALDYAQPPAPAAGAAPAAAANAAAPAAPAAAPAAAAGGPATGPGAGGGAAAAAARAAMVEMLRSRMSAR